MSRERLNNGNVLVTCEDCGDTLEFLDQSDRKLTTKLDEDYGWRVDQDGDSCHHCAYHRNEQFKVME